MHIGSLVVALLCGVTSISMHGLIDDVACFLFELEVHDGTLLTLCLKTVATDAGNSPHSVTIHYHVSFVQASLCCLAVLVNPLLELRQQLVCARAAWCCAPLACLWINGNINSCCGPTFKIIKLPGQWWHNKSIMVMYLHNILPLVFQHYPVSSSGSMAIISCTWYCCLCGHETGNQAPTH